MTDITIATAAADLPLSDEYTATLRSVVQLLATHGFAALHHCESGAAASMLLEINNKMKDADANGNTPLHNAAAKSRVDVVRVLLDANMDPNAKNAYGETPLHCAAAAGDVGVLDALINAGGTGAKSRNKRTPLHLAALRDHRDAIDALVKAGADKDATDDLGETALHLACGYSKFDALAGLIAAGANVNTRNNRGNTPLHTACTTGLVEPVRILLEAGADANADNKGDRPYHLCHTLHQEALFKVMYVPADDIAVSGVPDASAASDAAPAAAPAASATCDSLDSKTIPELFAIVNAAISAIDARLTR